MFRLLRLIVVVVILVAAGSFLLGYWGRSGVGSSDGPVASVGASGHVDTARAREAGAAIGEKTSEAAHQAEVLLADGAVTAKIKSKMALDETVQARSINVDTNGHIVTVSGRVGSEAERTRALQLARETAGVSQVIDRLTVGR